VILIITIVVAIIIAVTIQYDYYHTLQVVLARAEALAKAQFARSRDAHGCALMYVALKKKQLLLVRMLQQANPVLDHLIRTLFVLCLLAAVELQMVATSALY